jgi:hypothetical protein
MKKNEIKILWRKRKNNLSVEEIEELTKKGYDINIYGAPLEFADKLLKSIKCPWRIYLSETDMNFITLDMYFRNHTVFKAYAKYKNYVHRIFISRKEPEGYQYAGLFLRR